MSQNYKFKYNTNIVSKVENETNIRNLKSELRTENRNVEELTNNFIERTTAD